MCEATLEPLRSAVAPKGDRCKSGAKRDNVSLPHWSASALIIASARAALFAQVPEHVGRAFKQPDCRWIVCFESSTPTRPPHTPAILIASRARCTCVRLTYLHSCTSAGPFLSRVHRVHVHGRHHGARRRMSGGIDAAGCRGCAQWARAGSAGRLRLRASRADVVVVLRLSVRPPVCHRGDSVVLGSPEARTGGKDVRAHWIWA